MFWSLVVVAAAVVVELEMVRHVLVLKGLHVLVVAVVAVVVVK
jgi:hypothetical protein